MIDTLQLGPVFFGALDYPEYAWPYYFIINQKKSAWPRGVYLGTLSEVYHGCILRIQIKYNAGRSKTPGLMMDDIYIPIAEFTDNGNTTTVNKPTLEKLNRAIHAAYFIEAEQRKFSPLEILSIVEYALWFMKREYQYMAGKIEQVLGRPRTQSYFNYLIAQDGPFFDFSQFKNAVRELNLQQHNQLVFEATLEPIQKTAQEIVTLWNEDIAPIVHNDSGLYTEKKSEMVLVEFSSTDMSSSWWSDKDMFEVRPHKLWLCQDFAFYAAKITNLIMNEIFLPAKFKHRNDKKNFLSDLLSAIQLMQEEEIKEDLSDGGRREDPYRTWVWRWFRTAGYQAERETLKGTGHIDLKIIHPSIGTKIMEFKGWWNDKKKEVIQQTIKYLTEFEDEGYIFMINTTGKLILGDFSAIINHPDTGIVELLKEVPDEVHSPYKYYKSIHEQDGQRKIIYHFIYSAKSKL